VKRDFAFAVIRNPISHKGSEAAFRTR